VLKDSDNSDYIPDILAWANTCGPSQPLKIVITNAIQDNNSIEWDDTSVLILLCNFSSYVFRGTYHRNILLVGHKTLSLALGGQEHLGHLTMSWLFQCTQQKHLDKMKWTSGFYFLFVSLIRTFGRSLRLSAKICKICRLPFWLFMFFLVEKDHTIENK
jgi:hypothetical protein